MGTSGIATAREPWNKGKIVGQKAPFKLKDIWALRVRFQMESRVRVLIKCRDIALASTVGLNSADQAAREWQVAQPQERRLVGRLAQRHRGGRHAVVDAIF